MTWGDELWGPDVWGGAPILPGVTLDGILFTPIPEEPIAQILTWRTDVHKMRDGRERRISLDAYPRQRYDATYILDDPDRRRIRRLLYKNPATTFFFPLRHEAVTSAAAFTGGSTLFTVGTNQAIRDWAVPGRLVLIQDDRPDGPVYATYIESTTASSFTVTELNPGGTIPSGLASIMPIDALKIYDETEI